MSATQSLGLWIRSWHFHKTRIHRDKIDIGRVGENVLLSSTVLTNVPRKFVDDEESEQGFSSHDIKTRLTLFSFHWSRANAAHPRFSSSLAALQDRTPLHPSKGKLEPFGAVTFSLQPPSNLYFCVFLLTSSTRSCPRIPFPLLYFELL